MESSEQNKSLPLNILCGDEVRQYLWRFSDRMDLQMLAQASRAVARGKVAELVSKGARSSHEWTEEKAGLLRIYDDSGITAAFVDPEFGGFIEGPKNMALALIAFELSWVDAGAATCSLAGNLALGPIHERGTKEQRARYMSGSVPANSETGSPKYRGAFCLTEPIPYVGVDTGVLSGKVRVAEWSQNKEPILEVDKRGRFITNMGFANFVTAAVDSADPKIKGSCMIILEEGDQGIFDRGSPTHKFVHQLSSTSDPIFKQKVPASRIIGGYTVKDGVIIPRYGHGEIIEAVFKRTRVTVALMTSAKLLSSIEPVIRYHRHRYRGGADTPTDSPRYKFGIQHKEDPVHRLTDIWAIGAASASLGFWAARAFDELDPVEREKDKLFESQGVTGRAQLKALREVEKEAQDRILARKPLSDASLLVRFSALDSLANVLCPATKLWNTGVGINTMREAVSLMGGYGITEDCPGFLGFKWIDGQLEATYEGPESVQRRQLSVTMTSPLFLAQFDVWIKELETLSDGGAKAMMPATAAMELWRWTLNYLQKAKDCEGASLFTNSRQGVSFAIADALCWLLASKSLVDDVETLAIKGHENPIIKDSLAHLVNIYTDLSAIFAARAAGEAARILTDVFFGYQGSGTTPEKETFKKMRNLIDEAQSSSRIAKDRVATVLTQVIIPEAPEY